MITDDDNKDNKELDVDAQALKLENRKKRIALLMNVYLKAVNAFRPVKFPSINSEKYKLSEKAFSEEINRMEYKADKLGGLIDSVADPDTFFDDSKTFGRDCDDFQRQWSIFGTRNGYVAKEYVVCDPTTFLSAFQTMHVIGTLSKNNKFWLTNYEMYGPFDSEEDALSYMSKFNTYSKNKCIVFSREIKEE